MKLYQNEEILADERTEYFSRRKSVGYFITSIRNPALELLDGLGINLSLGSVFE
jgi:hypothetical protein